MSLKNTFRSFVTLESRTNDTLEPGRGAKVAGFYDCVVCAAVFLPVLLVALWLSDDVEPGFELGLTAWPSAVLRYAAFLAGAVLIGRVWEQKLPNVVGQRHEDLVIVRRPGEASREELGFAHNTREAARKLPSRRTHEDENQTFGELGRKVRRLLGGVALNLWSLLQGHPREMRQDLLLLRALVLPVLLWLFLFCLLSIVGARVPWHMIFWPVNGWETDQTMIYRSYTVLMANKVMMYLAAYTMFVLLFLVLDAFRIVRRKLDLEEDVIAGENERTVIEDWAKQTDAVGSMIKYPLVILGILLVSLAPVFDNFTLSGVGLGFIGFVVAVSLAMAWELRQRAYKAREELLWHLRLQLVEVGDAEKERKRIEDRITVIEQEKRGAFGPWFRDSLMGAPLTGGGILVVIQRLSQLV